VFSILQKLVLVVGILGLSGCDSYWNNPYPGEDGSENTLYTAFTQKPKHLDPAISYSEDEAIFNYQIYESPLQYHYLQRPYTLVPLASQGMPEIIYKDKVYQNTTREHAVYTVYRIKIKSGIYYQPHPAFAKKRGSDSYWYHPLSEQSAMKFYTLDDFSHQGTRECISEDFVYQIKRLADPSVNSPLAGVIKDSIVGFSEFSQTLKKAYSSIEDKPHQAKILDLRNFSLSGVRVLDKYTYEIWINGVYPQFIYWLATPFFAPIPWEAMHFYAQPHFSEKNITLDWYPVGTGPYYLAENNPNLRMVLKKNPYFHGEKYPSEGSDEDKAKNYLQNAGKPLPFLDKIVFVLERESIPYWNKFLQGYYDQAAVSSTNFDQAIKISGSDTLSLSDSLQKKEIRLSSSVASSLFYWGVNMLDDVIGGNKPEQVKLRQAIALAMDMDEYIKIFLNGQGIVANSPLPPGIFGYRDERDLYESKKSLEKAKILLKEAGYPNGISPKTQKPLTLYFDVPASTGPDSQAQLNWCRKQFEKLGIALVVRATQYSRFQDKMRNGDFQIFMWGWNADYPDPENFLFLFYGKNGKIHYSGENATNYTNPQFDALFEKMKLMPDSKEKEKIIEEMLFILKNDAPLLAGFHPVQLALRHAWVNPVKPNTVSRNTLKYISINPILRAQQRKAWNVAKPWPLVISMMAIILLCVPAIVLFWRKQHKGNVLLPAKKLPSKDVH